MQQSVGEKLRRHPALIEQPTKPREQPTKRHLELALRGPDTDIGEGGNSFAVGGGCFKVAVEHIGSDGGDLPLTDRTDIIAVPDSYYLIYLILEIKTAIH